MAPRHLPLQAHYIRASTCDAGCPMIIMGDAEGRDIAEAHIVPEFVEEFIAQLREAAEVGAARRRPLS